MARVHAVRLWPAVALACSLALVGCGKGHFSERSAADKANTFSYSLVTNPTHVDPALVQDGDTIDLTQQIFEGLVRWGQNNQVKGNLATSWDIKDGGTVYVFHLRKGVTFSNGKPFTANDFKWSIERACSMDPPSDTVPDYLGDIVGVAARLAKKAPEVSGVKVLDDDTVQITIDAPKPYFLDKLTYPCSFVVSKDACDPHKEMTSVGQMVGTGPFVASLYVEDQVFDLKANKSYHGGAPKIDGIERPILKDAATRLNAFKSGQVDLVQLERQDVLSLQKDPTYGPLLHIYPRPATYYLAFNTKVYPPFADRRIRRAFAMAVNCKEICDKTLGGLNQVADGVLPPGMLGKRTNAKTLPFDPAAARAELAAAGYSSGAALPPLALYFRSDREDVKIVAEAIQSYLRANLGVAVTLKPLDWTTYLSKYDDHQLSLYHMRWEADYLDPQDFLSLLLTTGGNENKQYYSNPEVDALCAQADVMNERDPARLAKYAKAEDIVLQDAAWLPIYFESDAELVSARVHGLRESAFGHLPHTEVYLSK